VKEKLMTDMPETTTDVLVIGGGPAGSTAASLLVKEGYSVVLLERDTFPREHIGESLLPSIFHVLDLIGAREKVDNYGFVRKYGAYFQWGADDWEIVFGSPDDPKAPYSFQVSRAEFDKLLLDHSRELGVDVREATEVSDILFDGDRPCAATWRDASRTRSGKIRFRWLIDASGRAGLLANRYLKTRRYNQGFQNVAAYSYWKGAQRPQRGPSGAINVGAIEDGWVWAIPLHSGLLSVGAVMHKATFTRKRAALGSVENVLLDSVANCPVVAPLIADGERVDDVYVEQDFSYISERCAGPGYFICGDAACFLDPLLSSGVHLATLSALLSAAGICSVDRGELTSDDAISYFTRAYHTAYVRFLVIVSAMYQNYQNRDSLFWNAVGMTHRDVPAIDITRAFRQVVSGLEDVTDMAAGGSALVMSEMRRLVGEYFPKSHGRNDKWFASLPQDEQQRVTRELRPVNESTRYCLSEESAIEGIYVRTKPNLGLARVEPPAPTEP
jgi:flavin-dependent dehydrogenase